MFRMMKISLLFVVFFSGMRSWCCSCTDTSQQSAPICNEFAKEINNFSNGELTLDEFYGYKEKFKACRQEAIEHDPHHGQLHAASMSDAEKIIEDAIKYKEKGEEDAEEKARIMSFIGSYGSEVDKILMDVFNITEIPEDEDEEE